MVTESAGQIAPPPPVGIRVNQFSNSLQWIKGIISKAARFFIKGGLLLRGLSVKYNMVQGIDASETLLGRILNTSGTFPGVITSFLL